MATVMAMDQTLSVSALALGIEAFLTHCQLHRDLSPHTLRAYQSDLAPFIASFSATLDTPEALQLHVLGYWSGVSGQGLAKTSLRRKASALKSLFKFLLREGYAPPNSLPLKFYQPKAQRRLPHFLTATDIANLRAYLKEQPAVGHSQRVMALRNYAIVEVLYSSGIRVSELVGLNHEDVNWDDAECLIRGKGNRERISFISQKALVALKAYRNALGTTQQATSGLMPVFLNPSGQRLSTRSVGRMLDTLGQAVGLSQPLHPHLFRHTFATHLLNQNVDLRTVQELLGHQAITSTQIYTHVTTDRLRQAYLLAHPRANTSPRGE
jgi:integrase/recombinase XerC